MTFSNSAKLLFIAKKSAGQENMFLLYHQLVQIPLQKDFRVITGFTWVKNAETLLTSVAKSNKAPQRILPPKRVWHWSSAAWSRAFDSWAQVARLYSSFLGFSFHFLPTQNCMITV